MADRQDSDREVLTSLPRSRPVRRSAKRGKRADAEAADAGAQPRRASAAKPRAAKAAPAGAPKARPKTATPRRPAAKARAKPAPARAESPPRGPARKVPPAGYAAPGASADDAGAAGAADLLGTTIQAAAELVQIGLTVGRQTLQSMLDRLPKP